MKKLISIFTLLLTFSINAQDPQLFENTWYLHSITVDGETHSPPNLEIEPQTGSVQFLEGENKITLYYCDGYDQSINYDSDDGFSLEGEISILVGTCGAPENWEFAAMYFSVFYDMEIAKNPFSYTITTEDNGTKSLLISNPDGDSALYGNELLSTTGFNNDTDFIVYPNPAIDLLYISKNPTSTIKNIAIYNIQGSMVRSIPNSEVNGNTVNIQQLDSSIYFMVFKIENGDSIVRKISKL